MITQTILHDEAYQNRPWRIEFEHQGASANICILGDEPDTAYLYSVFSTNRRKGEASALLREIEEYCVANLITLIIYAEPYDVGQDGIPTIDVLKSWYEKNGAHYIGMSDNEEGSVPVLLLGYDSDQGEDHE